MKTKIVISILTMVLASTLVFAQPHPDRMENKREKHSAEKMLKEMAHKLQLDETQVEKVKEILFNADHKFVELRKEQVSVQMKAMQKRKNIMEVSMESIENILDDEQIRKFEQMKKLLGELPPLLADK